MRARTGLWEPWAGNDPGPPGPEKRRTPRGDARNVATSDGRKDHDKTANSWSGCASPRDPQPTSGNSSSKTTIRRFIVLWGRFPIRCLDVWFWQVVRNLPINSPFAIDGFTSSTGTQCLQHGGVDGVANELHAAVNKCKVAAGGMITGKTIIARSRVNPGAWECSLLH